MGDEPAIVRVLGGVYRGRPHFSDIESLLDCAGVLVCEFDSRRECFSFVSDAAYDLLGLPASEWLRPGFWAERVMAEDVEAARSGIRECVESGEDRQLEYRMIRADRRPVWVRHYVFGAQMDAGRPPGLVFDISVERFAEARLSTSHHRFRDIVDGVGMLAIEADAAGRIVYANRFVESLFPGDSVVGRSILDFVEEADRERVTQAFDRTAELGRPSGEVLELQLTLPTGEQREIRWRTGMVEGPHGEFGGVVSIGEDVTERAAFERERARKAEEFDAIFTLSNDMFLRLSADDRVMGYSAPTDAEHFPLPSDILGKELSEVLPAGVLAAVGRAKAHAHETGGMAVGEYELAYEGVPRQYEARFLPMAGGETVLVVRDVTERKAAEDRIREAARLSMSLNAVDRSIHSSLDFDTIMQAALDEGLEVLGCQAGAIEVREGDTWVVRYHRHFAELLGVAMDEKAAPNATKVGAARRPFAIEDVRNEPTVNVYVGRQGLRSVLGVPLVVRGELIGCVLFYAGGEIRRFSEQELDFAGKFGASVSLALENARLYEGEREMARRVREQDVAIRRAYVDAMHAVTGGKFVLMTAEELGDALGEPLTGPERIDSPDDIARARSILAATLETLDPAVRDAEGLVLAACEGITNALRHGAPDRSWSVLRSGPLVQVFVNDEGSGIDFKSLPKAALEAGFSTAKSLGMGFTIMLECCDRVLLASEPGSTRLVLEMGPG